MRSGSTQFDRERLRPFLLDRLSDDRAVERSSKAAPADSAPANGRALSMLDYRRSVVSYLEWLLNSQRLPESEQAEDFPAVAASVANFGLPDLVSLSLDGGTTAELELLITRVLERFEPRIVPRSLRVRATEVHRSQRPGSMEVLIEADIYALPAPESVLIRTELDLGTGRCVLKER